MNRRDTQSGSIFFTLIGAVGIAAAITAGVGAYIKGPLKSAVNTHRQEVAQQQTTLAVKVATRAATTQPSGGDCDADGFIEPMPFLSAGTAAKPTGGGLMPLTMGAQRQDPWQREYGYCAWDHGATVNAVGCGGAGQNRLAGTSASNWPAIAVISAGPDGIFQTSCNAWADSAPADGSPDTPMVNKPSTSDDVVYTWNYGATGGGGGSSLWALEGADPNTAEITKNLSVKDAGGIEQLNYDILAKSLSLGTGGTGKFPTLKTDTLGAMTLNWEQVSLATSHSCSTKTDNTLWCWGSNVNGELGDGTTTQRTSPTQVGTDSNWIIISSGGRGAGPSISHTCAIKSDRTLWCWGKNNTGQLGDGTITQRISPVQVGTGTNWLKISSGATSTCGIKTDGTLWCWGNNATGQIGDGTTTQRNNPVQIGVATDWAAVFVSMGPPGGRTCAIKNNGTLWCWGRNDGYQLGDGTITQRNSPVQIGTATNWATVTRGARHNCGVQTNGTLWCWGPDDYGQTGTAIPGGTTIPTQVGTDTNWSKVVAGNDHSCALKTNGTLWCWGRNDSNELGDGTTAGKNTPTQIGTDTDWTKITDGNRHTCAIKSNGTLWCWGSNSNGQIGDGTTTQRSTPTQVPGAGGGNSQVEVLNNLNAAGNLMIGNTTVIDSTGMILYGEQDPKLGTLTNGKYCTVTAGVANCTANAPTGGDIQDGITPNAVLNGACTTLGELRRTAGGVLLVCDDDGGSQIANGSCTGFKAGALTFSPGGSLYFCANQ